MQCDPRLTGTGAIVDVWLAPPAARARFDPAVLHEAERTTWANLRSERRRRDFEVSRALSHAVSAQASGCWSLSHSHGYAALATAGQCAVGVDVEHCAPRDVRSLAVAAFTSDEARFVSTSRCDADRTMAFYELWVLKEACAKALRVPLVDVLHGTNFAAVLTGDRVSLGAAFGATDWAAWVFAPRPNVRLAVFCAGANVLLELHPHEWPTDEGTSWVTVHSISNVRAHRGAGCA